MAFRFNHLAETLAHHIKFFQELNASDPTQLEIQPSSTYGDHPNVVRAAQDTFARIIA